VVVCYAIDRLSRDPIHLGVILSEATHAGVDVQFVTEPLDHSAEGELIRFVRGYAAKVEHIKIKERSERGKRARLESGKLLPGQKSLYGYRWRDTSKSAYEIDPTESLIVMRIFQQSLSGKGLHAIARELSDDGVPTPGGKNRWGITAVARILHHPSYTGNAQGWIWRDGGRKLDPRDAIGLPDGTIPPIIDLVIWDAIQERLKRNKREASRNNPRPQDALLRAGFVRCGYCGRSMRVKHVQKGRIQYCCESRFDDTDCASPYISARTLDAAVWTRVEELLTSPDVIAEQLSKLKSEDPTNADIAAIDRSLAQIERRKANLVRAIASIDDEATASPLVGELKNSATRQQELENERVLLLGRRANWIQAQSRIDDLTAWCRTVGDNVSTLSYEHKRQALTALGVEATVYRSDHAPRYVITASLPLPSDIVFGSPK
jgi:site-specific DNA recombinase